MLNQDNPYEFIKEIEDTDLTLREKRLVGIRQEQNLRWLGGFQTWASGQRWNAVKARHRAKSLAKQVDHFAEAWRGKVKLRVEALLKSYLGS